MAAPTTATGTAPTTAGVSPLAEASNGPVLVFDGGCPFCQQFAQLSALRGGITGLQIRDGRAEDGLRRELNRRGYHLAEGAVIIAGDQLLHGAAAIQWICSRMAPTDPLLALLKPLFGQADRARRAYPLLLLARRLALGLKGLPVDPDAGQPRPTDG